MAIDIEFGRGSPPRKAPDKPRTQRPKTPTWKTPAVFPEDAAAILRRNQITPRQFSKFSEKFTLFLMSHCAADFAIALQEGIRLGNKSSMELFARMVGMLKNDAAIAINLNQQHNTFQATIGTGVDRSADTLIRMLDDRDRKVIEAGPLVASAAAEEAIQDAEFTDVDA